MIENLSGKYLLADRLNNIAAEAGVEVSNVTIANGLTIGTIYFHPDVRLMLNYGKGKPEDNEHAAELILEQMPELSLVRDSGLIKLRGTEKELRFEFYTGLGVCERVQVGERIIPAQPERVEPIFEIRCPDPLRNLKAAQS